MLGSSLKWAAKRAYLEVTRFLPDRTAIDLDYFRVFGKLPDLANPRRFSEKIQHLKLHNQDARMTNLVDKIRVKEFVLSVLGERWLIPTLWHGKHVTEDILRVAPKPAVIKANHSSAQVMFLHANSNLPSVARQANSWRDYDHHIIHREWAYGAVNRELLIEPFIGDDVAPDDYKFWVFDGTVRFIQVDHARFQKHTRQFYTPDWKRLDIRMNYPALEASTPAPLHLDDMLCAAQRLAQGFRFVRVDLYDTRQGPLFGEMTFAPEAGLCRFDPRWFDLELGESWTYPAASGDNARVQAFSDAFRIAAPTE